MRTNWANTRWRSSVTACGSPSSARDPTIVNRTVLLNNEPHTIVGVLPATSAFDRAPVQIWRPLAFKPSNMTRDFHWMVSFARLKDGVTLTQARANMDAIGKRIENDFPASNKGWGVVVEPYAETLINAQARTILLLLISSTGFLLLIGCANLANLALARGVSREREVVVRASLGAGRWDLIRQFLTENVLLSLCGGLFGLVIGYALMNAMRLMLPPFTTPARGQRQHGWRASFSSRSSSRSRPASCSGWRLRFKPPSPIWRHR